MFKSIIYISGFWDSSRLFFYAKYKIFDSCFETITDIRIPMEIFYSIAIEPIAIIKEYDSRNLPINSNLFKYFDKYHTKYLGIKRFTENLPEIKKYFPELNYSEYNTVIFKVKD